MATDPRRRPHHPPPSHSQTLDSTAASPRFEDSSTFLNNIDSGNPGKGILLFVMSVDVMLKAVPPRYSMFAIRGTVATAG